MAVPTLVQHKANVPSAAATAGGSVSVTLDTNPVAGHRLLAFVAENDNQIDGITITPPASWSILNPPNPVIRTATGHAAITGRVYERLSSAGAGDRTTTWTFSGACYPAVIVVELAGCHASTPIDVDATANGSASLLSLTLGGTPSTAVDDRYLCFYVSGNTNAHALPAGDTSGFSMIEQATSGGTGDAAKVSASCTTKAGSAVGETAATSVQIAGGASHNYVAIELAIPSANFGSPPSDPFGFTATGDGVIHRASSLHYYGGGIVGDATHTATGNASRYAQLYDIVIGNITENPTTAAITTDKFNGLAPVMRSTKANIGLGGYNKSVQIYEGAPNSTYYPNTYYAHAAPWPTGPVPKQFGNKYPVGQPTVVAGQPNYADPRGWTATSFKEQRARDVWATFARYNVLNSNALNCVHLDSMGTGSLFNQVKPENGTLYSNDTAAWLAQVWSIGDEVLARKPAAADFVVGNGLSRGQSYNQNTKNLLLHVNGAIAENWIHDNYAATPPGYRAETGSNSFQSDIDMALAVQASGKWFWGVVNIGNGTAGNPPSGLSQAQYMAKWSAAQLEQIHRYALATALLCDRGKLWVEYVKETAVKPWDEDHAYYHVTLGAATNATPATHADLLQADGSYMRDFASGTVWVNAKPSTVSITLAAAYVDPPGIGVATYATSSTISLAPNSGLVLLKPAGSRSNDEDPTVVVVWPTGSPTITVNSITVSATATDPDGIASAQFKLDSGAYQDAVLVSGQWTYTFTGISAGAHTVTFKATDANAAPRTKTSSAAAFTYTAPDTSPPSLSVDSPQDGTVVIGSPGTTIAVQGNVVDAQSGIASLTVNGVNTPFNSQTGAFATTITLALGVNTITVAATDASGNPTTTSVAVTLTLLSGGGGGDQTVVISTDIQDIELRIHQRGLQ